MNDGSDLERLTAAIQWALSDQCETRVTTRTVLRQANGQPREVDVLVTSCLSGHIPFAIAIECKDFNDKVGVYHIDALNGKTLPVQRKVMVSSSGYTAGARRAAKSYDILLLRYEHADDAACRDIPECLLRPPEVQHLESVALEYDGELLDETLDLSTVKLGNESRSWSIPLLDAIRHAISVNPPTSFAPIPGVDCFLAKGALIGNEPIAIVLPDGRFKSVEKISFSVSRSFTVPIMSRGIGRLLIDSSGKPVADAHAYIYRRPVGDYFLEATVRPAGSDRVVLVSHSHRGWTREVRDSKLTVVWKVGDRAPQVSTFSLAWARRD